MRRSGPHDRRAAVPRLIEQFEQGLDAPICLTWELTYACNLACVHCLSSSGKRDPRELSTQACKDIIDELERMQVFYVNIGGGEPTVRPDFWELVDYATAHHVGVKFSTNGVRITPEVAARLAASDYVDVQISLDGATAEVNDAVRGPGPTRWPSALWKTLPPPDSPTPRSQWSSPDTTSTSSTNSPRWQAVTAPHYASPGCARRAAAPTSGMSCTRPPTSRSSSTNGWSPRASGCYRRFFFHLSGLGEPGALSGLNMCGAGRVVCLIDPVGDVYACPFAIHDRFLAGNILSDGGFRQRVEERSAVS